MKECMCDACPELAECEPEVKALGLGLIDGLFIGFVIGAGAVAGLAFWLIK